MDKNRKIFASRVCDLASGLIIIAFLVLLIHGRAHLPVFSDSWYHLGVIRAFFEQGFSRQAWWEFAPFGRPHLYAPLFHLVSVALLKMTGWNLLELAQFYSVVTFPVVLLAGGWAARCLFDQRVALLTLLLLAINMGLLFPSSLIIMPGTYALLLWPFVFVLLLHNKPVKAGMVLTALWWLHFGVGCVALASVILFGALRQKFFKRALVVAGIAVVGFSPWLAHLFLNREFMHAGVAELPFFLPVFTALGAIVGVAVLIRKPAPEPVAVLAMILASGLFLLTLRERFWTYSGFLMALLGGYGLNRRWVHGAVAVLAISAVSVTPFLKPARLKLAVAVPGQGSRWLMPAPALALAQWPAVEAVPPELGEMARWVMQNTGRDEVLLTDDRLVGAAMFVLTGRRTTCGLWNEVMTNELRAKLARHNETSAGFIIVNRETADVNQPPRGVEFVAALGKYVVYRRR